MNEEKGCFIHYDRWSAFGDYTYCDNGMSISC